jgi:hypothetical protein
VEEEKGDEWSNKRISGTVKRRKLAREGVCELKADRGGKGEAGGGKGEGCMEMLSQWKALFQAKDKITEKVEKHVLMAGYE